jgi:serine protease Do
MPRVLVAFLVLLVGAATPFADARAGQLIFESFDARPMDKAERRLLQAALASSGDYQGMLDGAWGPNSQAALDAYAARAFGGGGALNLHAGTVVMGFLDELERDAWDVSFQPELGLSMALPLGVLGPAESEDGGFRRWSRTGSLTVLSRRFDQADAATWHEAAAKADHGANTLATLRTPDLMVTAGELRDGRRFFTRSDRVDGSWPTVFLASGDDQAGLLNLAAGSIRPGPPLPWTLPEGGRLAHLVAATANFLEEAGRVRPGRAASAEPPQVAALPQDGENGTSTGTGFYVGARTLLTAQHVIGDCGRVTLAGGAELTVLASDPELDVAALMAPDPVPRWLSLADGHPVRLGERVHAVGFPYYSIAGTSLHLTSGNVSALAGVDDDLRFFSFTAPVQPGNSGGPLLDGNGAVLGLVVARLSEDFIVETTGSLPQNVNYAVNETELAAFLHRNAVVPAPDGLGSYDVDQGVPDGFSSAVVPIVCH